MSKIKEGKTTSELWLALATVGVSALLALGILNSEQASALSAFAIAAILAIPTLPGIVYATLRTVLKVKAMLTDLSVIVDVVNDMEMEEYPEIDYTTEEQ